MLPWLIKRLLMLVPVFLAVSVVIFSILHFIPGDPIDNLLKIGSSPEARAEMEVRYGLDKPLAVQYSIWLGNVVQGDLGTAIVARRPVADLIAQALPHSLRLGGLALLFSTVVGVLLGVVAALNRDRWPDRAIMGGVLVGSTMPSFWLGLILILVFSVSLGWFPVSGARGWQSLVLPVLTIGLGGTALVARITRVSMIEAAGRGFVTLLHAKGLSPLRIQLCHLLCPARSGDAADQVPVPTRLSGGAGLPFDAGDGGDARHAFGRYHAGPDGPAGAGGAVMIAPLLALTRPQGGIAGLWLILVIVAALFAAVLTPYAYDIQNLPNAYQPASAQHWLGTDEFGRDLLTRLMYGARTSLSVSATAISISVLCGMVLGAAAAWFGGWLDRIVTMTVDLTWSFPEILIALILVAIIGPGTTGVMIAIAVAYLAQFTRLTRAQIMTLKGETFIEAARSLGAGDAHILFRHLLPNALAPGLGSAMLATGDAIILEATLGFFGLGAQPPVPSWGGMMSAGSALVFKAPWVIIFPGLAVAITVVAINLYGDALIAELDIRARLRRDA